MCFYIVAPNTLLPFEFGVNVLYNFCQKSSGACCWIQYLHFVHLELPSSGGVAVGRGGYFDFTIVCQALWQTKFGFQNIVNGTNYEVYNRFWRVPNATCFSEFWVIFAQERFIKMDDWVFHFCRFSIIFQNFFDVARQEYFDQTIYNPLYSVVYIGARNVTKQFSKKWVRFRYQFCCFLPRKSGQRWVVQPSGKHSVGNGLGIYIGKTFGRNVVNQDFFKSVHLVFQRAVLAVIMV